MWKPIPLLYKWKNRTGLKTPVPFLTTFPVSLEAACSKCQVLQQHIRKPAWLWLIWAMVHWNPPPLQPGQFSYHMKFRGSVANSKPAAGSVFVCQWLQITAFLHGVITKWPKQANIVNRKPNHEAFSSCLLSLGSHGQLHSCVLA